MTFLHGTLLAGIALVAIPIVLHLVMRQKPRHLPFPALRFLQQRQQAHRRSLRWQHLLLLALRCAVLAVLALALARPSLVASGFLTDRSAPLAAVMVVDTAPRMEYRAHDQTRLQAAQEWAKSILEDAPSESEIAVMDTPALSAAFSVDLGAAKDRIAHLTTQSLTRPLPDLIAAGAKILADSEKRRKEVYVFTDLSAAAWPGGHESLSSLLPESAGFMVNLIDVGVAKANNSGIVAVRLSSDVANAGRLQVLHVDLRSQGQTSERSLQVWLTDPTGQKSLKTERPLDVSHADQSVDLPLPRLSEGLYQGEVRLTGEDALAADDVAYFSLVSAPPWKVLLAAPQTAARTPEETVHFVQEALAPFSQRQRGEVAFQCSTFAFSELLKLDLAQYDAILLVDPTALSDDLWRALSAYAAKGRGVGVLLGESSLPVEAFNRPPAQEILAGQVLRQFRVAGDGTFLHVPETAHPILNRFRQYEEVPWSESPVWRFWQLRLAPQTSVVLEYANHEPALIEKSVGRGRAVTMTTNLASVSDGAARWNMLPLNWPCPMLVEEMTAYLCGRGQLRLNYDVGQTAVLTLSGIETGHTALVTTPSGDALRHPISDNDKTVLVTATQSPGNYQVAAGGEKTGVRTGFSVNLSPDACELARVGEERLAKTFGQAAWRLAHSREEMENSVATSRDGFELYPYLILLLLLLLVLEQIAANRFYGAAAGSQTTGAKRWARLWRGESQAAANSSSPPEVTAP